MIFENVFKQNFSSADFVWLAQKNFVCAERKFPNAEVIFWALQNIWEMNKFLFLLEKCKSFSTRFFFQKKEKKFFERIVLWVFSCGVKKFLFSVSREFFFLIKSDKISCSKFIKFTDLKPQFYRAENWKV